MGKGWEGIAVNTRGCKVGIWSSCEAHDVGISAEKDCGGTKGEMGKAEGGAEEGGIVTTEPAAIMWQAFVFARLLRCPIRQLSAGISPTYMQSCDR